MKTKKSSNQKTVLITGASSGLGREIAILFSHQGYRVFGTSRKKSENLDGITMLILDVTSDNSVKQAIEEILSKVEKIDILINNAGIEHLGIAEESSMDEIYRVFQTNFFGVVRMVNSLLPLMRKQRDGRIINIGSMAAWVGEPCEAFYSASKHALFGYTEALRHEVWPLGIHVSLVEPGAFKTDIIKNTIPINGSFSDYDQVREAAYKTLEKSLKHGGDPMKVAKVTLKIARTSRPRFRYPVGGEARWIPYLRVFLPQRIFDYSVRKGFGLKKM